MFVNARSLSSNDSEKIVNLVKKYYHDVLDRDPEPGAAEWWTAEIERIISLGIDIKEGSSGSSKVFLQLS